MRPRDITFHHPVAFWLGCAAVVAGVLAHLPMLAMAAPMHYRLAGMPMDNAMLVGMALVPLGVLLAGYGLMPRMEQMRRTLVLFAGMASCALLFFFVIDLADLRSTMLTTLGTVALLLSISGVIATLIPYAAEIYPVHLRSSGAGLIAACSKFGGILGAGLGVAGLFGHFMLSAVLIALPLAAAGWMLARSGIETRGHDLEAIQEVLSR